MPLRDLDPPKRGWMISKATLDYYVQQRLTGTGSAATQLATAAREAGYRFSDRLARDVLRCERPFDQRTLDAVAAALSIPAEALVAAESDSIIDLLQPRRLAGIDLTAALDLVQHASTFFAPQLRLVHLGYPPADGDHPCGRPFGGSRPRSSGYGLFRIRYRVPSFSGVVSYSIGQGPLALWIDYGTIVGEGSQATSHESWFPGASPKLRVRTTGPPGQVTFLTWLDDFPTAFLLRCNDPEVSITQDARQFDPVEGDELLHRTDAQVVGFERTFHAANAGKKSV